MSTHLSMNLQSYKPILLTLFGCVVTWLLPLFSPENFIKWFTKPQISVYHLLIAGFLCLALYFLIKKFKRNDKQVANNVVKNLNELGTQGMELSDYPGFKFYFSVNPEVTDRISSLTNKDFSIIKIECQKPNGDPDKDTYCSNMNCKYYRPPYGTFLSYCSKLPKYKDSLTLKLREIINNQLK